MSEPEQAPDSSRKPSKPVSQPTADAPPANVERPSRRQGSAALILALVAICLSLGFAATAYFIWSEVQRLAGWQAGLGEQVDERLVPLRTSVERLARDVESSGAQRDQRSGAIERRLETLSEDQETYDNRLSVLAALMGRSEQGWSLAEVEYLLRIASQRLQLQRDVATAVAALQSADTRLRELADPHYLSVREQLARELEALNAVPVVDRDGIALTLGAWLERVATLAVAGARYEPMTEGTPVAADAATTAPGWRELPGVVWAALARLFELRQHDKPVTPMLPPEREYFLRENLRLQLSAARLALMRDDKAQYRAALDTARDWLGAYFAAGNSEVAELTATLDELGAVDIRPDLPDLSGSLRLLRQQMKLSEQQAVLPVVPGAADRPRPPASSQAAEDAGGVDRP